MQISETVMLRTRSVLEKIRDNFKSRGNGAWASHGAMNLPAAIPFAHNVLRNLVKHGVLERKLEQLKHGRVYLYRPTQGGWAVLGALNNYPLVDLHDKFGKPFVSHKRLRPTALPHKVETKTLVGGSPEGQQLIANQKHLLNQVNKLIAEVDGLRQLIEQRVSPNVVNNHMSKAPPVLSAEVLQALGEAVLRGRTS